MLHVLVLGALTAAIFAFAAHRRMLHAQYTHVLGALEGALGGAVAGQHSWLVVELLTLALNLAVVVYLLPRHRLFGLRGGAAAERAERNRDSCWPALERFAPPAHALPIASTEDTSAFRQERLQ